MLNVYISLIHKFMRSAAVACLFCDDENDVADLFMSLGSIINAILYVYFSKRTHHLFVFVCINFVSDDLKLVKNRQLFISIRNLQCSPISVIWQKKEEIHLLYAVTNIMLVKCACRGNYFNLA